MIHLNQAGTSWPKPEPVREAVAEALAAPPESWDERLSAQHAEVARALGLGAPEGLLLTPGATAALALAVSDLPWEAGDRVLESGWEHHALHGPLRRLAARGVVLEGIPPAGREPLDLDALDAALGRGGVRLVAVTAASNVTGALLPVADVAALAHRHGALCLVDAAQIAGWLDLDPGRLGADLVAFAGHKGPQGPWGIGGLWTAPHVPLASPEGGAPGGCDVGSLDRAALAGLVAGLRWLAEPGRADRLARARRHAETLAQVAEGAPGVTRHGPDDPEARMPVVALTVRGRSAAELARALAARGVLASGGLQCAPLAHRTLGSAPDGVLRLSVGPSHDDEQIETAAGLLREVLGGDGG